MREVCEKTPDTQLCQMHVDFDKVAEGAMQQIDLGGRLGGDIPAEQPLAPGGGFGDIPAEQPLAPGGDIPEQPLAPDGQIVLPPPLELRLAVQPPMLSRRSRGHIQHARDVLGKQRAERKCAAAELKTANTISVLDEVLSIAPHAAVVAGRAQKPVGRKKKLAERDVRAVARAAFIPSKRKVHVGIKHKRLIYTASRLIKNRQTNALKEILKRGLGGRILRAGNKRKHFHVTYSHVWDEVSTKFQKKRRSDPRPGWLRFNMF